MSTLRRKRRQWKKNRRRQRSQRIKKEHGASLWKEGSRQKGIRQCHSLFAPSISQKGEFRCCRQSSADSHKGRKKRAVFDLFSYVSHRKWSKKSTLEHAIQKGTIIVSQRAPNSKFLTSIQIMAKLSFIPPTMSRISWSVTPNTRSEIYSCRGSNFSSPTSN